MIKTLILYSSRDGQTKKICTYLQKNIHSSHHQADIASIAENCDLSAYDRIIIGASIRYGKHNKCVYKFIESNAHALNSTPSAFFSVNLVARKPEKQDPATNPYVSKFLKQISWRPALIGVFAGHLDYQKYGLVDRAIIRLIMRITKGPTDPSTSVEYTDWQKVNKFCESFLKM